MPPAVTLGLVHQMEALEDAELYEFSSHHFDSDSHRLASQGSAASQRSSAVQTLAMPRIESADLDDLSNMTPATKSPW